MNDLERGHESIARAVAACRPPVVVVECLRQFGDVLHSTLLIRHFRTIHPDRSVVWAISERYVDAFAAFTMSEMGPHAVAALPHGPPFPEDAQPRIAWVRAAAALPGVERATGCGVHPWGWKSGSIVDAFLDNGGVGGGALAVPRRPCLPIDISDFAWNDDLQRHHGLSSGYVALEHVSYSLGSCGPDWYADLVRQVGLPVVALGAASDPPVPGAIDAHGCTFRQAKATIMRARAFVGCGSGLSVLAATDGCMCPVVELVDPHLSMAGIGYLARGRPHSCMPGRSAAAVAAWITAAVGRG